MFSKFSVALERRRGIRFSRRFQVQDAPKSGTAFLMKTASVLDLPQGFAAILTWLHEGETVVLLEKDGNPLGRIVPERKVREAATSDRRELFARRFAPLANVPVRNLGDIVDENRGER